MSADNFNHQKVPMSVAAVHEDKSYSKNKQVVRYTRSKNYWNFHKVCEEETIEMPFLTIYRSAQKFSAKIKAPRKVDFSTHIDHFLKSTQPQNIVRIKEL